MTSRGLALRRAAALSIAVCAVLGPTYLFARYTLGSTPRQVAPPPVTLSSSVLDEARRFPSFAGAVPVIAYHDVSHRPGRYTVTPERFAKQMAALAAAGFETVTLDDVRAVVNGETAGLPEKPLLITFDDGPGSTWATADPALARYGFTAVAFIVTGAVVESGGSYYLSWDQIDDLHRSGRWAIGAHTPGGHRRIDLGGGATGPWLTNLAAHHGRIETLGTW